MANTPRRRDRGHGPAAKDAPARTGANLKVRVKPGKLGQYPASGGRRRAGDVFRLQRESDFSRVWMEWVSPDTPEHTTTPAEALRKVHATFLGKPQQLQPNAADLVVDDEKQNVGGDAADGGGDPDPSTSVI